ncbi:MAG TPA: glycosyltransferase [Solirubrobacteraceae bacterium]|jgi:tetratricopeptide (TPR) repeat protein
MTVIAMTAHPTFGEQDHNSRYQAVVKLIERGLADAANARQSRLPELYATVATNALEALEGEPSEPKLLNLAGVALYELWSLDAAQQLFEAALRLDPALGEVQRNLAQLAQRRRSLRGRKRAGMLHPSVGELERRAALVAQRAQPAQGLRLSLCMIVRDEQEMLGRCLQAVRGAVDEMVIVDTGSKDATIEIARSFGANVIEREWTGSFGEARNVAFDAATGDWTLVLDADELLVVEDVDLLRSLTGRTWREAFYVAETNYTGELDAGTAVTHNTLRVFRNRPQYRYRGRLHEQIASTLPTYLPERLEYTNVRIEHYGYLGAVRDAREKSRRNIELLRMQQEEGPETPFLHYNLGAEYAVAGDPAAALVELERAWEILEADPARDTYQFAPALANRLVRATRACGRLQDAIDRAEEGLARFPGFTDLVLEQGAAHVGLGEIEQAMALYERCLEMGDAPGHYTATVGCGTFLAMIALGELRLTQGQVAQAKELLERCVSEYPEFIGALLPYASALLAQGAAPEQVLAEVQRRVPEPNAAACFLLGTALYEGGATEAGEQQFRLVLERQPNSSRARVALAESLLAQRRYFEAAAVACEIRTEDQLAVMACRSELFARLAGGDKVGAGAALARAQGTTMTPAELDLFTAWFELAGATRQTEIELTDEALVLLEIILEALLRVHDFEVFEVALGLLQRTPLAPRERSELLGELYLRRGFAASAAEEWLTVCREQPEDVRALFGLARVAERQGMAREAVDFAQAALAAQPEHSSAAELLERVRASGMDEPAVSDAAQGSGENRMDEDAERRAAA